MSESDEENDCQAMATRVAGVTLESDSLPEGSSNTRVRRKKKIHKRPKQMEIDPQPTTSKQRGKGGQRNGSLMEWEGACPESDLCSSESLSSDSQSSVDRDADDEQSDWVGYGGLENDEEPAPTDRRRRMKPPSAMSTIQRKLERFSKESGALELCLDIKVKERTHSVQFNRLLQLYKLEIVRRFRGTVTLKKKKVTPPIDEKISD